ncbi:hypothetical protein [Actinomadura rupiterrae]|uniref:hypothetical protein n=1 Tax=Actinomadura rupiterrae TaxID=559627 RepID=UPI0020A2E232|nr:hypothetical protein [Actinomadura rupiterrae]MCP2341147.1 hypothetical protein [Actinomadura rupiterrae]
MLPTDRPTVLLITSDCEVMDRIHQLAASVPVWTCDPDQVTAQLWNTARLILIDARATADLVELDLPQRRDVILLLTDPDALDARIGDPAAALSLSQVTTLDDPEDWIGRRIQAAAAPASFTVAIVGAQGGIGASTLAGHVAVAAANTGRDTVLIDADPMGGGLACADPDRSVLTLLTQGEDGMLVIPPDLMAATIEEARMHVPLVIVDLPRHPDAATALATALADLTILVTDPARLAAARQVLRWLQPPAHRLAILTRPAGRDDPWVDAVGALGGRLLGQIPDTPAGLPALCSELIDRELPAVPQHT